MCFIFLKYGLSAFKRRVERIFKVSSRFCTSQQSHTSKNGPFRALILLIWCYWIHFGVTSVDQKVNRCWPNFEIFARMHNCNQISIYSFWNGLELAKTDIYMKNGQNLATCTKMTPQLGFSLHYIYIFFQKLENL